MHRPSTAAEKIHMFGAEVVQRYPIVDHCATEAKVLQKVQGPAGLIYCTNGISAGDLEKLPLTSGYTYTGERELGRMVQKALQHTVTAWQQRPGRPPRLGVILDGAHAIPCLTHTSIDA
jgi:hypothetical protein